MSNTRKAVFIDFDGTLYDHGTKAIPASAKLAIINASKNNDLFLATGRSGFALGMMEDLMPYFKGFVLMNGAHIVIDGKTIEQIIIPEGEIVNLKLALRYKRFPIALLSLDHAYFRYCNEEVMRILGVKTTDIIINTKNNVFDSKLPYSMGWAFASKKTIQKLEPFCPSLSFVYWGDFGCDILPPKRTKAEGIDTVIKVGDYLPENIYVVGNGDNDVEMFLRASKAVAMANSSEKAIEAADYVTTKITEDGLKNAFKWLKI